MSDTTSSSIYRSPAHEAAVRAHYDAWLAQIELPLESVHVDTRAGRTHLLVAGPEHAPPLMLVHGMNTHALFMAEQCKPLCDRYRCYFVDVPGGPGRSEGTLPHFNDGSFGRWMRELLDGLGVERVGMVGVSMGGLASLWTCAEIGERVARAVFIVPAGFVPVKFTWPMLRVALRQMLLQRWPSAASSRRFLSLMMRPGADIDARMIEVIALLFGSLKPADMSNEGLVPEPVPTEALAGFRGPSLVIAGSTDAFFPGEAVIARAREVLEQPQTLLLDDGHIGAGASEESFASIERFLSETDALLEQPAA